MNLRGAIQLDRPLTADQMRPGLLSSVVADDELGDGRLRYRTQRLIGYHRDGRPIYQVKGSSRQGWVEALAWQEADGPAVTGTAAASLLIPSTSPLSGQSGRFTLPANFFDVGKVLRITAAGRISNIVTTPGTLTLDVRLGSTVVFNGGAVSLNIVAKTNVTWWLEMLLTCRSIGATAATTLSAALPASAPAAGTGFDSTVANVLDLFATFSLTGNSITAHEYTLEALN